MNLRPSLRASVIVLLLGAPAFAQDQPAPQPPSAPSAQPAAQSQGPGAQTPPAGQPVPPQTQPPPQPGAQAPEPLPPVSQRVYSYPAGCGYPDAAGVVVPCSGQWVYTTDYGWVWVPGGTASTEVDGVPYTYLYTPAYGWTWYVSPWGFGPYYYGGWVVHAWYPLGWRGGWVAGPRVFVRLGGHGGYRGGRAVVRGGGGWHGSVRGGGGGHGGGGHGGGHR